MSNRDEIFPVTTEKRPTPLTNPSDIMMLLGRFAACGMLFILTIAVIVTKHVLLGVGLAIFSIFWQRATLGLWRRLRDERLAAEAALSEGGSAANITVQGMSPP